MAVTPINQTVEEKKPEITILERKSADGRVVGQKVLSLPTEIERKTGKVDTSGRYLYYLGAKETICDVVLRLIPHNAVRLIEPFTGSGALASGLAFRFKQIEASDLNAELIEAHNLVINHTEDFIVSVNKLFSAVGNNTKAFYDSIRKSFNASSNMTEKAAYLVFMNRKGFKGLMRRNGKGEFNVPFWEDRADEEMPESQIRLFAERLGGKTRFSTRDFRKSLEGAGKGDFCYLDPPYLAEQGKDDTFAEYVGAFVLKDHQEMAALCRAAADKGATVVVSNHDSDLVRTTYGSADAICSIVVQRSMSDTKGQGDSSAKEILAVWLPPSNWFEAFVRKPALGTKLDRFNIHADHKTMERKVFKVAEANGWLVAEANENTFNLRSLNENGQDLLRIVRHGSPIMRRLVLEKQGREKLLPLRLLESLIIVEFKYSSKDEPKKVGNNYALPAPHLLSEIDAATKLLDLAKRLEKTLADHPLRDEALTRILKSKAEIYITRVDEVSQLPVKRLPDRYKALLDTAVARSWTFDSEPCQRLLFYAEVCEDRGSNDFIRICKAFEAQNLTEKMLLAAMPQPEVSEGKRLGIEEHKMIPGKSLRKMALSFGLSAKT
jgi:DNA adenine methylase